MDSKKKSIEKIGFGIAIMFLISWIWAIFIRNKLNLTSIQNTIIGIIVLYVIGLCLFKLIIKNIPNYKIEKGKISLKELVLCFLLQFSSILVMSVLTVILSKITGNEIGGEIDALIATITPSNTTDKNLTWTSSDESVATVTPNGEVIAIKVGTATITARTSNNKTSTCRVTITEEKIPEPSGDLPFTDTKKGAWYYESVKGAYQRRIIKGYDNGKFGVNDKISRGQLVVILYRLEGETDVSSLDNPFEDVAEGKYYTDAIKWAYANHIVNGYTATTFAPTNNIKRKDFAVILNNYAKYKSLDVSSSIDLTNFADYYKVEGNYAEPALKWAAANKIISGAEKDGKRYLNPNNNATRAEASAMIMNFINKYAL